MGSLTAVMACRIFPWGFAVQKNARSFGHVCVRGQAHVGASVTTSRYVDELKWKVMCGFDLFVVGACEL